MHESRRAFLGVAFGFAAASALAATQRQIPTDHPAIPEIMQPPPFRVPKRNPKLELKANEEKIKKDIAKLSDLVAEIRTDLDNNDTKEVLPINLLRKTE